MPTKSPSKPNSKSAPPKAKTSQPSKTSSRSLEAVVGPEVYRTWVSMLCELVPDGRTHRLSVVVAGMLQYAVGMASKKQDDEGDEKSIIQSLLYSTEVSDPDEVKKLLHDTVTRLFKDAHVEYGRVSARGEHYSIAEEAYDEYIRWFDMPWE